MKRLLFSFLAAMFLMLGTGLATAAALDDDVGGAATTAIFAPNYSTMIVAISLDERGGLPEACTTCTTTDLEACAQNLNDAAADLPLPPLLNDFAGTMDIVISFTATKTATENAETMSSMEGCGLPNDIAGATTNMFFQAATFQIAPAAIQSKTT